MAVIVDFGGKWFVSLGSMFRHLYFTHYDRWLVNPIEQSMKTLPKTYVANYF